MSEGAPLLLARHQTRREALVLQARIAATRAGLMRASVHGPDEESLDAIPVRAIQMGQAAFNTFTAAQGGAAGGGGAGGARPAAAPLRAGQIGYFDRVLLPTRTLPVSAAVKALLVHNEQTLLPDLVAYIRLGAAAEGLEQGPASRPAEMIRSTHLPNLRRGGWKVLEATELMRAGERARPRPAPTAPIYGVPLFARLGTPFCMRALHCS